ncbi:MAG: DUF4976 domain-containing protein [Candidatus Sumerlaeota bacterium]|nr:DUF4976 domain-containing protein [Candidatus Sumerlaeota bacterium]
MQRGLLSDPSGDARDSKAQGQILDGVSLVPLLKQTGKPQRDALFFYFPHGSGTKEPGMACRQGDWKLIWWFDTNEVFPDEYELYNLRDDLSETKNLAAKYPEKVREIRALMDRHLHDTHAVPPIPNPAFDPKSRSYRGWQPLQNSRVEGAGGVLIVESKEGRPQMRTVLTAEVAESPLKVRMRMRAPDGGDGIVYWSTTKKPSFSPECRADFQTDFNGEWKEYEVPFRPAAPVYALRLDLSAKPTRIEVQWIRLYRADGAVIQEWDFAKPPIPRKNDASADEEG